MTHKLEEILMKPLEKMEYSFFIEGFRVVTYEGYSESDARLKLLNHLGLPLNTKCILST